MKQHQQLYEINTRNWLHSLRKKFGEELTLLTIPENIWINIIEKGFDWIWLMGVWKHSPLNKEELMQHPGLIKEITQALPNWDHSDIIGSPYSIIKYELNPQLGLPNDLILLKRKLNDFNAKLMLDFIPNHFGNASELVITNPEYFISMDNAPNEKFLFRQVITERGMQWIAYGKDPYFSPWTDTFQLNYFNKNTRKYMIDILQNQITRVCDGVRCDMAMLCLNDIINKTWGFYFQEKNIESLKSEFWEDAIKKVKSNHPDFIFLAEVYWDLGWKLQSLGFDYTYDKKLYDRLMQEDVALIRGHLIADKDYQKKSMRYIENHDEQRAVNVFGHERSIAAAIIMGTILGLSLYHQGQLKGESIKLPVQLQRKQKERPDNNIQHDYECLLKFTNQDVFQNGQWLLLETSTNNILAWQWYIPDSKNLAIVVVNYSAYQTQGNVFIQLTSEFKDYEDLRLNDILNEKMYTRKTEELKQNGLYIDLLPYKSHLFSVKTI